MRQLPSSWAWASLADVASWGSGGTPAAGNPRFYGGEIPWAVIGDLNDAIVIETANAITSEGLTSSSAKVVPEGTLLIAMYGSIGKLGITGCPMATNQAIAFASVDNCIIENRYLFWFLSSERDKLMEAGKGATQKNISQTVLKSWPIPVPPLPEQRRIVATLDDHLSRLDAATSNVNKAAARVMQLRRSIYSYIASGRIMSNADNDYGTSSELVNGWTWVHPDDVTSGNRKDIIIGPFGSDLRVADYKEDGIPLVFVRNIRSGTFGKDSTKYISQTKADELRAHQVTQGDVLITKMGEPPGDSCVYTAGTPGIITADCIRLRPSPTWDPRYLSIAINSPLVRPQIARITRGIAQRKVSLGRFRDEVKIPVPPPALQSEVVEKAERLLSLVDSLEASLVRALKRRDSLRRALFTEAFTGRLVPQDTADEPVALLLERIQSRRALQPAMRRGRRTAKPDRQEETLL
jgi:type I restriction enzyme, S subunit